MPLCSALLFVAAVFSYTACSGGGKRIATITTIHYDNSTVLASPEFIKLPEYVRQSIDELLHLEWTLGGNEQYTDISVLVNGSIDLTSITNNFDLYKRNIYYPPTSSYDVILELQPTDFSPGTYTFQLCVSFANEDVTASDNSDNPNCSAPSSVTLTRPGISLIAATLSSSFFALHLNHVGDLYSVLIVGTSVGLGAILILSIIFVIIIIVVAVVGHRRKRRQHNHQILRGNGKFMT